MKRPRGDARMTKPSREDAFVEEFGDGPKPPYRLDLCEHMDCWFEAPETQRFCNRHMNGSTAEELIGYKQGYRVSFEKKHGEVDDSEWERIDRAAKLISDVLCANRMNGGGPKNSGIVRVLGDMPWLGRPGYDKSLILELMALMNNGFTVGSALISVANRQRIGVRKRLDQVLIIRKGEEVLKGKNDWLLHQVVAAIVESAKPFKAKSSSNVAPEEK